MANDNLLVTANGKAMNMKTIDDVVKAVLSGAMTEEKAVDYVCDGAGSILLDVIGGRAKVEDIISRAASRKRLTELLKSLSPEDREMLENIIHGYDEDDA
jgi:hypothetical protein